MKKIIITIAAFAALTACMPPNKTGKDTISQNEEMMRKFNEEVINKHNANMVDSLVAPDYVDHEADPGFPPNRAGLKKAMDEMIKGFPDITCKINRMVADSNTVWIEYTTTGTNTGTMMGMPATGKKINIDGVEIVRYKDGKAVEHWGYAEDIKMMQQLGMMPAMTGGMDSTKAKMPADSAKKM